MKKFIGFIVLAFWVVGGLLLTPGVSFAQGLPTPPGIQIFDDDFNGISVVTSGTFFGSPPVITQETATGPGSVIWNFGYSIPRATTDTFSYNIYEAGTNLQNPPTSALSDTLLLTLSPAIGIVGTFGHLEFFSGPLNETFLLAPLSNATAIVETGALQTPLNGPPVLIFSPFQFQSDLDVTSVPDPRSLLLFGAGLMGMAVIGRRKERRAT